MGRTSTLAHHSKTIKAKDGEDLYNLLENSVFNELFLISDKLMSHELFIEQFKSTKFKGKG